MHVVINAQLLSTTQSYRSAGVSNYSRHLLQHLGQAVQLPGTAPRLTAFVNDRSFHADGVTVACSPSVVQKPTVRIAWEQCVLPLRLRQLQADLVHGLVNVLPLFTGVPGVVTVHDLSFLHKPEVLPAAKRFYLARLCQASVVQARRVIAVSRQTADDLIRYFAMPASKISVIYNGVSNQFTPADQASVQSFRQQRGLPERFLLYLGTLEPRKNLEVLIRAFARWRAQTSARNQAIKLVVAGGKGWFYQEIFRAVKAFALEGQVLFPGFIPEEELPNWYRAAEGFVYPSLFEGFGLPVLEAMACGAPVLCSQIASLLEIVEDGALTFPPHDEDALVAAVDALVNQPLLRATLRAKGLQRSTQFTWQRSAQATLEVYRAAAD
jgi:glycosyltransferase involved in cell wall biosynthesis